MINIITQNLHGASIEWVPVTYILCIPVCVYIYIYIYIYMYLYIYIVYIPVYTCNIYSLKMIC